MTTLEPTPKLSRGGVAAGLFAATGALVVSAPAVEPTTLPDRVDALVSVLGWWVAVGLLVWLILSLGLWAVAYGRPSLQGSGVLRAVTVPGSRRLVEGLLGVGLLAACSPAPSQVAPQIEILRPAGSGTPTTLASPLEPSVGITVDTADLASVTTALAAVGSLADARDLVESVDPDGPGGTALGPVAFPESPHVSDAPEASQEPEATSMHVVVAGENFWTIAEGHLSVQLGRAVTDAEIGPYWAEVVAINSTTIRSGDPDLIYPGEVVELPPLL